MKKIILSRKSIIILLITTLILITLYITLLATNIVVTGSRMRSLGNNPSLQVQTEIDGRMATVTINNNSDEEFTFGERFELYRRFGFQWRRVFFDGEFTGGLFWTFIGFGVPPNSYEGNRPPIDLERYFDQLSSGEYRIVIPIFNTETREEFRIAGSFRLD